MKQKHIEDLFVGLVVEGRTIKEAMHHSTLVMTKEVKNEIRNAVVEALYETEDNANARELHAHTIKILIEVYRDYYAKNDTGLYGYYDLEDGSEYEEYRTSLSYMEGMAQRIIEAV